MFELELEILEQRDVEVTHPVRELPGETKS
jgi:hypothetical protein